MVTIKESVTFAIESGAFDDQQIKDHMSVTQDFIDEVKSELIGMYTALYDAAGNITGYKKRGRFDD